MYIIDELYIVWIGLLFAVLLKQRLLLEHVFTLSPHTLTCFLPLSVIRCISLLFGSFRNHYGRRRSLITLVSNTGGVVCGITGDQLPIGVHTCHLLVRAADRCGIIDWLDCSLLARAASVYEVCGYLCTEWNKKKEVMSLEKGVLCRFKTPSTK